MAINNTNSSNTNNASNASKDKTKPHSIFDNTKYLNIEGLDYSKAMTGDTAFINSIKKFVENFKL
jgi:hypothetical protein